MRTKIGAAAAAVQRKGQPLAAAGGPEAGVKSCLLSGAISLSDVLLEHSYCLSAASPGVEATNGGCSDEQVLSDEQQAPVIDHQPQQQEQEQQREKQEQREEGKLRPEVEEPRREVADSAVGARSRRVRRVPAKFMTDDQLFDDVAEFPVLEGATPSASAKQPAKEKKGRTSDVAKTSKEAREEVKRAKEEGDASGQEEEDEDPEEEEDDDDDEDPYKEYCICRKPHGNRFMIMCDHCDDWFHGSCIGLSKKQAEVYEVWVCATCRSNDPSLAPLLKTSAKAAVAGGKSDAKKPKPVSPSSSDSESESGVVAERRVRASRPATAKTAKRVSGGKAKAKGEHGRNGVQEESEREDEREKQRLREVIEKAKRDHAEKLKRRERRQGPLDPTMNQLFQVTEPATPKSPSKTSPDLHLATGGSSGHRIRCMICRGKRVNSDKTIYCSLECMRFHVRQTRKKRQAIEGVEADATAARVYPVFDAFDATDVAEAKRKREDVAEKELLHFLIRNPGFSLDASLKAKTRKASLERSDSRKSSVSEGNKTPVTPTTPVAAAHPLKKKLSTDVEPCIAKASKTPAGQEGCERKDKGRSEDSRSQAVRERVSRAFVEALEKRVTEAEDLEEEERLRRRKTVTALAQAIEKSLFHLFQSDGRLVDASLKNYLAKYRSLTFNFNNSKNRHLLESLFAPASSDKHVSPDEVVRMTPEELARGSDLDAWRKIEAKKSLINSVIVSEDAIEGPKLKKTRKGDEEIPTEAAAGDEFARTPDPEGSRDKDEQLNPLEMILKEIKSSSKSFSRRDDVEDVPKSPERESSRLRRTSEAGGNSPADAPVSPDKRKRSLVDEEVKGRTEVKRVKIAPEITSILSLQGTEDASPEAGAATAAGVAGPLGERKLLWHGFCSGFEDPSASSSFNPALNSSSRFPVMCRTLVTDAEAEKLPFPPALNVVGRIAPEQVSSYVQKLVQSSGDAASESIVEMLPLTLKHKHAHLFTSVDSDYLDANGDLDDDDDESLLFRENYNKFINYLIQRKRYAVVDVKSASQNKKSSLKDVYLLPFSLPVATEAARSSQLPSKMLADLFDSSPLTQEIRSLKTSKPVAILIMLLIKKAASSSRERSGSSSSTSTTSSSTRGVGSLRRVSSHQTSREDRIPEERSFTPPPPPATAPSVPAYVPTPIVRSSVADVAAAHEPEEYDPASYIPGLSPDQSAADESDLREKALIQMRLLHSS